jgi:hypothetical protein
MNRSWRKALPRAVRWPVVGIAFAAGLAMTVLAIFTGYQTACAMTHGCGGSKFRMAKLRAKANRDAVEQFAIDQGRCPSTHDELVAARYLDRVNVRDPWGTDVAFLCAISAGDTVVTVRAAGPDRTFDTADDVVAPD